MVVTHAVMRFLVAGLVLIAIGIGLTEYSRRHEDPPASASATAKKTKKKSEPPPTTKALIETSTPDDDQPAPLEAFAKAVTALQAETKADGFTTVLSGTFTARELKGSELYAVAVVGVGETTGLVGIAPTGTVTPLVARKNAITAVAVDGTTVVWAEGGRVFSMAGDHVVKVRAQFASASVAGLAAKQGVIAVALVPKDGDPFSTEATGAVVKLEAAGTATLVAAEQVRPHDLLLEGTDVFFVAGYPSSLTRATLDGSFSAQVADRADGPLAFDGEGIVHRYPQTEVRRVARAGGSQVTLAHGDIDWLGAAGGVTHYTTVGIGARLYEVKAGEEPKEVLAVKGTAKGLVVIGEHVVLTATTDEGPSVIRVK